MRIRYLSSDGCSSDLAKAMVINTRNIKLLAFSMGASFGGVAGAMFASMQGFVSPESFSLTESIMVLCMVVLGGMGNIPGVILGAIILSVLDRKSTRLNSSH